MTTLFLAFDTSLLWDKYCIMRLSIIYRWRAIPLVWKAIEHSSSSVSLSEYKALLEAAAMLLPLYVSGRIIFLADRGFAYTELMRFLTEKLHWHIRIKSCSKVYRAKHAVCNLSSCAPKAGEAQFWHSIRVTDERFGPVHLAMAHVRETKERWYVLSSLPTSSSTI